MNNPYRKPHIVTNIDMTMNEKLQEMNANLERSTTWGGKWVCKLMWLRRRKGVQTNLYVSGSTPEHAVYACYQEFKEMEAEGWKKSK